MRIIDADVLFSILHEKMKGAEEWRRISKHDAAVECANTAYDTLYNLKMELEDEVETINEPTIETKPVRRGYWLYTEAWPHRVYCSVCYRTYALKHWQIWEDGSLARAYCPNCGAEMEGVE